MHKAFYAAVLMGGLATSAQANAAPAAPAHATEIALIQGFDDAFAAALNRGDGAAAAKMYAPDATMLPSDNKVYKGADIAAFWTAATGALTNVRFVVLDAERIAPGYIREICRVSFDTRAEKPTHVDATASVVWKRVGGKWMLWTDTFH
ncbi:nuclear transport factor 2 family protein [Novosphingobium sp. FKTRR1]|uniref:nuclear transport factor 2 family protein n=1 Tax=Novosphingobium sp. FKTRR1 TaxID=2879118 RepID=UPI001CEFF059|nr:nuclear transport factor 2 family protein [Novosphingobium sp. FKTRR1]